MGKKLIKVSKEGVRYPPQKKQIRTKGVILIENSPYIGLFALLILGGIGVPLFPEDATFILCGFLIQAQTVKTVLALLVIHIGVLIADFILYSFGKKYGRMVVFHRWFHEFLSPEKLTDLEDRFKKERHLFYLAR